MALNSIGSLQSFSLLEKAREIMLSGLEKGVFWKVEELQEKIRSLLSLPLGDFFLRLWEKEKIEDWYKEIFLFTRLLPLLKLSSLDEFAFHDFNSLQLWPISCEQERDFSVCFFDSSDWPLFLKFLGLKSKKEWHPNAPSLSFTWYYETHKFRVTLIHPSLSPFSKGKVFFRRIRLKAFDWKDFHLSLAQKEYFQLAIAQKKNILVSGATGSGKTSFLCLLLQQIDQKDHVIIVEDTQELFLEHPFVTYLLGEESTGRDLKSCMTYSLRLSPDRIILGEMRSHEVLSFILAMNTGHRGLLSTLHADSAVSALERLEVLIGIFSQGVASSMRGNFFTQLICQNIHIVAHVANKKVDHVIEVLGHGQTGAIFRRASF